MVSLAAFDEGHKNCAGSGVALYPLVSGMNQHGERKLKPKKWEKIKLEAQRKANIQNDSVLYAVMEGVACGTTDWRGKLDELQALVWGTISKWDIRKVKTLCDIFPGIVAKDCLFICEMDERGEWVVY